MPPSEKHISPGPFQEIFDFVGDTADRLGTEVYAVGGVVRDLVLERETGDVDFVTIGEGSGIRLAEKIAKARGAGLSYVHRTFGTAGVRLRNGQVLEFVAARKESYQRNSRKPLVKHGTLEEDLDRRDFTINTLAIALNKDRRGSLVDRFGGIADIREKVLRTPLEPAATFSDDPLRMMRAARFAAQLGFSIDPETFSAMTTMADRISIVSQERITDEIQKIMKTPAPSVGFAILFRTGILHHVFPALTDLAGVEEQNGHRHKDNFYHTLQVVDNVCEATADRDPDETLWLRWAALLHDIGKPRTKRFSPSTGWTFHGHEDRGSRMIPSLFKRLRLPVDDRMRYVQKIIRLHHRPVALVDEIVTDSAVRRLLFDAGEDIDDLMALVRADITSKNPRRVKRYLRHFDLVEEKMIVVEEKDRLRNFEPPVDGHEIMVTLHLEPGPAVGMIKNAIEEAILDGAIPNEHDAAFAFMMEIKDEILLRAKSLKPRKKKKTQDQE